METPGQSQGRGLVARQQEGDEVVTEVAIGCSVPLRRASRKPRHQVFSRSAPPRLDDPPHGGVEAPAHPPQPKLSGDVEPAQGSGPREHERQEPMGNGVAGEAVDLVRQRVATQERPADHCQREPLHLAMDIQDLSIPPAARQALRLRGHRRGAAEIPLAAEQRLEAPPFAAVEVALQGGQTLTHAAAAALRSPPFDEIALPLEEQLVDVLHSAEEKDALSADAEIDDVPEAPRQIEEDLGMPSHKGERAPREPTPRPGRPVAARGTRRRSGFNHGGDGARMSSQACPPKSKRPRGSTERPRAWHCSRIQRASWYTTPGWSL